MLWYTVSYTITMTSVFFKNFKGAELWENIMSNLDQTEKVRFIT